MGTWAKTGPRGTKKKGPTGPRSITRLNGGDSGPLASKKYEEFCQLIAQDVNKFEAGNTAGFGGSTGSKSYISEILTRPHIKQRIQEIKDYNKFGIQTKMNREAEEKLAEIKRLNAENHKMAAQMSVAMSKADIISMLLADREQAKELRQMSAAIKCIELIGKEMGLFAEKKEIRHGLLDGLDTDKLSALVEDIRAEKAKRIEYKPETNGHADAGRIEANTEIRSDNWTLDLGNSGKS